MTDIKFSSDYKSYISKIMADIYKLNLDKYTIAEHSDGVVTVTVSDDRVTRPQIILSLEDGGLECYMSVYPGLNTSHKFTIEEMTAQIAAEGVVVNVDEGAVERIAGLHEKGYFVDMKLIAVGIPVINGKDAMITLNFAPADKKPKIDADGKVDYKEIDSFVMTKKGDMLISKRPASPGVRGLTVKNNEIAPIPGKDVNIFCGEGVMINAAGTGYVAIHDGYVDFQNNFLAVHQVLFLDNVDFSTGNIKFTGTVHVRGDVLDGFKIEADNDVIVEGICVDCEITAGNNIVLKTGIKGNGDNFFRAGGDIVIGYAERARLFSQRDIHIKKYAYNSEIYSGGMINATAGDGIIAGGVIKAYSEILAKQLGTAGNSRFSVYLGTKYYVDQALESLRRNRADLMESLSKISSVLKQFNMARPEIKNNPKILKLFETKLEIENSLAKISEREDELIRESKARQPRLKVKGTVHAGITIIFFNYATTTKDPVENAVFYFNEKYAEVAWVSLKNAQDIELAEG